MVWASGSPDTARAAKAQWGAVLCVAAPANPAFLSGALLCHGPKMLTPWAGSSPTIDGATPHEPIAPTDLPSCARINSPRPRGPSAPSACCGSPRGTSSRSIGASEFEASSPMPNNSTPTLPSDRNRPDQSWVLGRATRAPIAATSSRCRPSSTTRATRAEVDHAGHEAVQGSPAPLSSDPSVRPFKERIARIPPSRLSQPALARGAGSCGLSESAAGLGPRALTGSGAHVPGSDSTKEVVRQVQTMKDRRAVCKYVRSIPIGSWRPHQVQRSTRRLSPSPTSAPPDVFGRYCTSSRREPLRPLVLASFRCTSPCPTVNGSLGRCSTTNPGPAIGNTPASRLYVSGRDDSRTSSVRKASSKLGTTGPSLAHSNPSASSWPQRQDIIVDPPSRLPPRGRAPMHTFFTSAILRAYGVAGVEGRKEGRLQRPNASVNLAGGALAAKGAERKALTRQQVKQSDAVDRVRRADLPPRATYAQPYAQVTRTRPGGVRRVPSLSLGFDGSRPRRAPRSRPTPISGWVGGSGCRITPTAGARADPNPISSFTTGCWCGGHERTWANGEARSRPIPGARQLLTPGGAAAGGGARLRPAAPGRPWATLGEAGRIKDAQARGARPIALTDR
jgi:hypothetical protein